jgi:hypothetical protein
MLRLGARLPAELLTVLPVSPRVAPGAKLPVEAVIAPPVSPRLNPGAGAATVAVKVWPPRARSSAAVSGLTLKVELAALSPGLPEAASNMPIAGLPPTGHPSEPGNTAGLNAMMMVP